MISINKEKCVGCGACESSCPFGAIKVENGTAKVLENCTGCGACVASCPVEAIESDAKQVENDLSAYKGVLVYCENYAGKVKKIAFELLSEGRKLADEHGAKLYAAIIGENVAGAKADLFAYGADEVYVMESPELADYRTEAYTYAVKEIIDAVKPEIVLIGASIQGRDLAPRLAGRIHTGLTADCTGLSYDEEGNLKQTRPAFGGNLFAEIVTKHHRPQMATVRPGVMKLAAPDYSRTGKTVAVEYKNDKEIRTTVKRLAKSVKEAVNLQDAEVIVAGGRGLGNAEGFELVKKLADVFGGAVGASRGAVYAGWISADHQVGQTGKTVRPKIYIACGISGAIQHIVGMQNADAIIAINTDANAPIFDVADYGIVGDVYKVIPAMIQEFSAK